MAIDAILVKVVAGAKSKELRVLAPEKHDKGNPADTMFDKSGTFCGTKSCKFLAERCVIYFLVVTNSHVEYMNGLFNLKSITCYMLRVGLTITNFE